MQYIKIIMSNQQKRTQSLGYIENFCYLCPQNKSLSQ